MALCTNKCRALFIWSPSHQRAGQQSAPASTRLTALEWKEAVLVCSSVQTLTEYLPRLSSTNIDEDEAPPSTPKPKLKPEPEPERARRQCASSISPESFEL